MYWFFSSPGWGLILWILSMLLVLAGGWLIATHVFTLESRERVLAGFALGLVCDLWLVNWIGRILPPFWTYLVAALLVLLLGVLAAYPFRGTWLDPGDLRIGGWIAAGLVLFWIFLRISKGTGLFDEYKNLALISTLANGWIPPPEHFGQPGTLRYHFGFHYLGASMMQLGHFAPWSAFDVSKSIIWSLSLLLVGLVGWRYARTRGGAVLVAAAAALSGGTRYLLLLLPSSLLTTIAQHVTLRGIASGGLVDALSSVLPMEASPRIGFPFAFLSGIDQAYVMAHGGSPTIEPMLLMLALLLMGRPAKRLSIFLYTVFFSFWALASETSMVLFAAAWLLVMVIQYFRQGRNRDVFQRVALPTMGLAIAFPLILIQGGTITAVAQRMIAGVAFTGPPGVQAPPNVGGFSIRWPPAILSGQMGEFPVTDPWALLAGILEMGIVVVMMPWITYRVWRFDREGWQMPLLLGVAWLGILMPLFLAWISDANIAHITDFGVDSAVLLLAFMVVEGDASWSAHSSRPFASTGLIILALMVVPGSVLMGVQLTAAQDTVLSEHYSDAEARLLQQAWGRLPRDSKVLGYFGPASILTGQLTAGIYSLPSGSERPVWEEMLVAPNLRTLLDHDFDFVYVNSRWWNGLDPSSQQELQKPCVTIFARGEAYPGGNFAEILDLRGCH